MDIGQRRQLGASTSRASLVHILDILIHILDILILILILTAKIKARQHTRASDRSILPSCIAEVAAAACSAASLPHAAAAALWTAPSCIFLQISYPDTSFVLHVMLRLRLRLG